MNKLKEIIGVSIEKLNTSPLYNPLYGKNLFFLGDCIEPKGARNQLLGYLGVFCGFQEVSRDIDYCIIPYQSSQHVTAGTSDEIIARLNSKVQSRNPKTGRITNTIPDTSIIPEEVLFSYIADNLVGDDRVKQKLLDELTLPFSLSSYEDNIAESYTI